MNQKLKETMDTLEKLQFQMEQIRQKIREAEDAKIQLENEEFVSLVRSAGLTPDELAAVLRQYKGGAWNAED